MHEQVAVARPNPLGDRRERFELAVEDVRARIVGGREMRPAARELEPRVRRDTLTQSQHGLRVALAEPPHPAVVLDVEPRANPELRPSLGGEVRELAPPGGDLRAGP